MNDADFDYVVVGAGTAGCVVASRLAESGKHTVLLIEAGGMDRSPWIHIPLGYGRTYLNKRLTWGFESQPDEGIGGRTQHIVRGRVVGGSGAINGMVHLRGHPDDYNDWMRKGNTGWGWDDVLPFFRRSERVSGGDPDYRGSDGPLKFSDVSSEIEPTTRLFIEACRSMGMALIDDFNGAQIEGVGVWPLSIHRGVRVSTASAYLKPALTQRRLVLLTQSHVQRVLFKDGAAEGVEVISNNRKQVIRARKEVILCGGAINSPQLLQLSGVADAALLQGLGIPIVADAPAVGQSLQDHANVQYVFRSRLPTLNDRINSVQGKIEAACRYLARRDGILSRGVNQAGALIRSRAGLSRPNLHIYFDPISFSAAQASRTSIRPDPFSAFIISVNPCRPTSMGSVTCVSPDASVAPAIRTRYLASDHDIREAIEGARMVRQIAAAQSLKDVIESELLPGPSAESDEQLLADARQRARSGCHPCGTCAMGPDSRSAVVDPQLRVYGTKGLRVIDASCFPTIPSTNINAAIIMLAEKGAELVAASSH